MERCKELCVVPFLPWWGESSRHSIPNAEVVGNDRQSGAIERICSSMKVHQWSFSSRLEILANSSLLRA